MSLAARDRSYGVRRTIAPGTRVRTTAPFTYYRVFPAGTEAVVVDYTNAGFGGITAALRLDDGTTVYGVSAGILTTTTNRRTA